MKLLLVLVLTPLQLFAAADFRSLRDDLTTPEHCKEMKLSYYRTMPAEKFYVGRDGALAMGFTFEYPIKRGDATVLWKYFKLYANGGVHDLDLYNKIKNKPALKRDFDIIMANFEEQNFDFGSEGEILEILAIEKLYREFPENQYFITGGVEYSYPGSHTLGEIDIYVADRQSCEIVAVGESKLGKKKTLNKAKKQLQRFSNFLKDNQCPDLADEYKPQNIPGGDMRDEERIDDRIRQYY